MSQDIRNDVGSLLLRLTIRELFNWRFMQTDPNWGNFLYDEHADQLHLIDFGAAKEYPKPFVDDYLRMVLACADKNREELLSRSTKLKFLTGWWLSVTLAAVLYRSPSALSMHLMHLLQHSLPLHTAVATGIEAVCMLHVGCPMLGLPVAALLLQVMSRRSCWMPIVMLDILWGSPLRQRGCMTFRNIASCRVRLQLWGA